MEELSAQALAAWDTENHFRTLTATGNIQQALAIVDRLDVKQQDGESEVVPLAMSAQAD